MTPIRHVTRTLTAPDGSRHKVRIPVYAAPTVAEARAHRKRRRNRTIRRGRRRAEIESFWGM